MPERPGSRRLSPCRALARNVLLFCTRVMKNAIPLWLRFSLALAVVAGIALVVHQFGEPAIRGLVEYARQFGEYAPLAYALSGGLLIAACVPASLVFLGAGVLFGAWEGCFVAAAAGFVGSCLAFAAARWLCRPRVQRLASRSRRFRRLDAVVGNASLRTLWLFRLSPIVPLLLIDLSLGASRSRPTTFLASIPASFPATFLYVYSGHAARGLLYGGARAERTPLEWALLGVGLVATVVAIGRARQVVLRAIHRAESQAPQPAAHLVQRGGM